MDTIASNEKIVIHKTDIDAAIFDACQELEVDDLKTESQQVFKAVLAVAGKALFPTKKELKSKNEKTNYAIPETNHNKYDYDLLSDICDYYISILCNRYNKIPSVEGFCYLTNINIYTVLKWKNNNPSESSFQVCKKLFDFRFSALKDKQIDSPNITGAIAVSNSEFGQSAMIVEKETTAKAAATLETLPKLSLPDAQNG